MALLETQQPDPRPPTLAAGETNPLINFTNLYTSNVSNVTDNVAMLNQFLLHTFQVFNVPKPAPITSSNVVAVWASNAETSAASSSIVMSAPVNPLEEEI